MRRKYTFTLDTYDFGNYIQYCEVARELAECKPLTSWDEISVGDMLHIPPIIIYKRRDFIVEEKTSQLIRGKVREFGDSEWNDYTIFKSENSAKFLVKILNGK